MKKIFLSVREDVIFLRKEMRDTVDQKLIEWILSLDLLPIIISNKFKLKHLNSLNADGLIISGGSDVNKNTQRYSTDKMLLNWARKKESRFLEFVMVCNFYRILMV